MARGRRRGRTIALPELWESPSVAAAALADARGQVAQSPPWRECSPDPLVPIVAGVGAPPAKRGGGSQRSRYRLKASASGLRSTRLGMGFVGFD